jgi:hypothetical protein
MHDPTPPFSKLFLFNYFRGFSLTHSQFKLLIDRTISNLSCYWCPSSVFYTIEYTAQRADQEAYDLVGYFSPNNLRDEFSSI